MVRLSFGLSRTLFSTFRKIKITHSSFSYYSTKMREAYVTINDVPTHIMTWGKWIEESFNENEKEVVVFITGNPGLPGFYSNFLSLVHEKIGPNIPVWAIAQAGHDIPPVSGVRKFPELKSNIGKFNLAGQVEAKRLFVEKYVPKGVKINFVGHSIGSWMILQLLKNPAVKERVKHCYCLFPTIERMATSPNGSKQIELAVRYMSAIKFILSAIAVLPLFLRTFILYIYFYLNNFPVHFLGSALKYLNPTTFENSITMAQEEMQTVVDLDVDNIVANKKILKFYYSVRDGWVPLKYYTELKERIPDVDAEVDKFNMPHVFTSTEKYDFEMSNLLSKWIKEKE